MVFRPKRLRRDGVTLGEFAAVGSVTLVIIFILIVGGLSVFRYQEVAHLAREGARYASTHGGKYQQEGFGQQAGVPSISAVNDANLTTYVAGQAVLLDPSKLTVEVSWTAPSSYTP